ncbi:hypothetical protein P872_02280 [Rhodonellum psychrophilum GCM71 = DSM 17998]|uniref:DUF3311 domain-containing protein n=2 Tax=Rhodonellum TaxID=336827 RepID=U5C6R5_9BACT|nr:MULTISPECIES: hypothetical protein [Rhodonellum]ERM83867.1 hypothetical protein P872_02280 [Rhodonellum psychrophilum GCM71 = DSM 17998]MDO9554360.1 hypothetical protein [Rhodonellum sp.]SDY67062.1 hypothetical protein SAMN05444412_102177 [Rhodonellum ikkaensis]
MKAALKGQYLWVIFFLGIFLLNYPVLSIYNIPEVWYGIPVLYLLVFLIWAFLILVTFLVLHKSDKKKDA